MNKDIYNKRIEWFSKARFGMFIHWGLYSIPAMPGAEWWRSLEEISTEDYNRYFEEFNPVDYNPLSWAKLAKKAGMKYMVLTAKHHDGFCLFDSAFTDYKATNTKANRDLIKEYVDALRSEGLKVGIYYSIIDWCHSDYPHFGDKCHPMRNNESYKNKTHDFNNYLMYMHRQVEELCTNYGKIDLLWFDFSYDDLTGEAWRATDLVKMVRHLQPEIIINNRLEVSGLGFGSLLTNNPNVYSGDFVSPECIIPPNGILDVNGNHVVWESCIQLNNHWGYCKDDTFYKSPEMVIKYLVECVSKGGNLLLNVGPDAKGNIPPKDTLILESVGEWMKINSKSIYNCGISNLDKPEYGRITRNSNKLYYHVFDNPVNFVPLIGLKKDKIKRITLLSTGEELTIIESWVTDNYPNIVFISISKRKERESGMISDSPFKPQMPDAFNTVIEVELIK